MEIRRVFIHTEDSEFEINVVRDCGIPMV